MLDRSQHDITALSIVIPMHNSAAVIARTIERWREYLQSDLTEIILVENGSTDVTWSLAQQVAEDTHHVRFVLLQSEKGMGNALCAGINASSGNRILLSADDLPFDFGDLEESQNVSTDDCVIVGSKAHPLSQTDRAIHRGLFTLVFRWLRAIVLHSSVGDSQGTIMANGAWLRGIADTLTEPGFLFSTQLIHIAESQGIIVTEVPVVLSHDRAPKESTVRWHDAWSMGIGLFRLRQAHGSASHPVPARSQRLLHDFE